MAIFLLQRPFIPHFLPDMAPLDYLCFSFLVKDGIRLPQYSFIMQSFHVVVVVLFFWLSNAN